MSYPTPLTPDTVQALFQTATIAALQLPYTTDPISPLDPVYGLVRIGWQQQGQPTQKITEDITYLRATEEDEDINRTRDFEYVDSGNDTEDVVELTTYTRVWKIFWTIYGPNSFDRARMLRSALLSYNVHDLLAASNLYLVTSVAAPRRVPELRNGQWWERVDFEARFNEGTVEAPLVPTATSVDIDVVTVNPNGQ